MISWAKRPALVVALIMSATAIAAVDGAIHWNLVRAIFG